MPRIWIKLHPSAGRQHIEEKDGMLHISVKSPPENGKANQELKKLLKKHLGKEVRIIAGHTTTKKLISFEDETKTLSSGSQVHRKQHRRAQFQSPSSQ